MNKVCTKCHKELPLEAFHDATNGRYGKRPECKDCSNAYSKKYENANKDKRHAKNNAWFKAHPEKRLKYQFRKWAVALGTTEEIVTKFYYEQLSKQDHRCAICRVHEDDLKRRLVLDHNHLTNKLRGLLCTSCNAGIGNLRDDANLCKGAMEYLIRKDMV